MLVVLGSLLAGVIANSGEESRRGGGRDAQITAAEAIKALEKKQKTVGGFIETVRREAYKAFEGVTISHTLFKSTTEGPDEFNLLTFFFPLQLKISETRLAQLELGVRVPYIFAKTFTEIGAVDPQGREEILRHFADTLKSQLSDELIVRGISGVTDFTLWQDSAMKRGGEVELSERKIDVAKARATGTASDEANIGDSAGVRSLGVLNPQNEKLAADRLNEILAKFPEILEAAGISPQQIRSITNVMVKDAKEIVLAQQQIAQLAGIAEKMKLKQFEPRTPTQEKAYWLITEHNSGNRLITAYFEQNSGDYKIFTDLILASRAVTLRFDLQTEFKKHEVITIPFPLPLLLLLLMPTFPWERRAPFSIPPITWRRIFTEKEFTEEEAEERRRDSRRESKFEETYSSLPSRPGIPLRDAAEITRMFIIDEVAPSFERGKYAGFSGLDYSRIFRSAMYRYQDERRKQNVDRDAVRADITKSMTLEIAKMWQESDRLIRPTYVVRTDRLIPYEESRYIVSQAKAVAEYFMWNIEDEAAQQHPNVGRIEGKIKAEAKELLDEGAESRIKLLEGQ